MRRESQVKAFCDYCSSHSLHDKNKAIKRLCNIGLESLHTDNHHRALGFQLALILTNTQFPFCPGLLSPFTMKSCSSLNTSMEHRLHRTTTALANRRQECSFNEDDIQQYLFTHGPVKHFKGFCLNACYLVLGEMIWILTEKHRSSSDSLFYATAQLSHTSISVTS